MPTDDSDTEGTSPSLAKLSTSAGSSRGGAGGKKTERNFWQYNVQAKGPKGQKIVIETKIEDPHVLNDIVDPVFSGDVQLQVWIPQCKVHACSCLKKAWISFMKF